MAERHFTWCCGQVNKPCKLSRYYVVLEQGLPPQAQCHLKYCYAASASLKICVQSAENMEQPGSFLSAEYQITYSKISSGMICICAKNTYIETVTIFSSFRFGFKQVNKKGFILKSATMSGMIHHKHIKTAFCECTVCFQ